MKYTITVYMNGQWHRPIEIESFEGERIIDMFKKAGLVGKND